MNTNNPNPVEQRKAELKELWKTKRGQNKLLSMCHHILAQRNESLRAGIGVFDVILDDEFGRRAAAPVQSDQK